MTTLYVQVRAVLHSSSGALRVWYYVCVVSYVVMYVHMCTLVCSDVESVITCYYMYVQLDTYEH